MYSIIRDVIELRTFYSLLTRLSETFSTDDTIAIFYTYFFASLCPLFSFLVRGPFTHFYDLFFILYLILCRISKAQFTLSRSYINAN